MSARLLSRNVLAEVGAHTHLDPADVLEGSPLTTTTALAELGGAEFGIWEITPGTVRDTEVEEIFVVLTGSGTVEFEDGISIELAAGVAVRLFAGDRTIWRIRETIRKIYFAC